MLTADAYRLSRLLVSGITQQLDDDLNMFINLPAPSPGSWLAILDPT
ncbi:hypothetical protein VO64_3230 [Pseudomonas synxantha]|uniref:Uncharacterized protein n=1 Tax=Pseudomonas synxantha TaxID=47883 RepID=A0AAU8TNK6_9PSED|nr:hypothetical protein VO64_3230 [Pseudomonas synxantha]